jgi:indole-3-glycerol phosphate synthase
MMTILENIITHKKKELDALMKHITYKDLERNIYFSRKTTSLVKSLSDCLRSNIIAEFKRMSPSKGTINSEARIGEVAEGYTHAGASGLSILTDRKFFGGSPDDLLLARELTHIPILRKDFIIDEFQVIQSKSIGADVILLIAAALKKDQVSKLAKLSHSLGLEVILEIHSRSEFDFLCEHIDIVGVNNRDLKSFEADINISVALADEIPGQFLKIAESGISSPFTVKHLQQLGYNGFLIGELFMKRRDPVSAFSDFIKEIS